MGFRPTVARLAGERGIAGWVRNAGGLAECLLAGVPEALTELMAEIRARFSILRMDSADAPPFEGDGFRILESAAAPEGASMPRIVPPDAPVCDDCLRELGDPSDRRYRHPFISCAACGPRYSILRALPYDRDATAMSGFPLCERCANEYTSPEDRRFHAQTVACPDCGPKVSYRKGGAVREDPIGAAVRDILSGGIVAVKGIGGFHLACLPEEAPVARLREIKGREAKPFALMFRDVSDVEAVCNVNEAERALLTSFARPIVLIPVKVNAFSANVTGGSLKYGCFLPYTPVHRLLLDGVREAGVKALVMTSLNVSGEPILYEDERLPAFQQDGIAGILTHDRPIVNPSDDSVARVIDGKPQILRRARGYAPLPLFIGGTGRAIAAGGDLKAASCVFSEGYAYIAPHVGDLEDANSMERYGMVADNLLSLLGAMPGMVAADMHPRYFSRAWAEALRLPLMRVQHHHAHIASVMAEHGLSRALGVAFDGTGYGPDGTVWGGEFLLCDGAEYARVGSLMPVLMAGGDESMRDANKIAACYQAMSGVVPGYGGWGVLEKALRLKINTACSSSMGRLFDAASAILGICPENRYEGECAIRLEQAAALARRGGVRPSEMAFDIAERDGFIEADWRPVIRVLSAGGGSVALALGFHEAVADMVERTVMALAERHDVRDVALSGGVFLNRILTERCLARLRARSVNVYINHQAPPGDGGISLGQAFIISR